MLPHIINVGRFLSYFIHFTRFKRDPPTHISSFSTSIAFLSYFYYILFYIYCTLWSVLQFFFILILVCIFFFIIKKNRGFQQKNMIHTVPTCRIRENNSLHTTTTTVLYDGWARFRQLSWYKYLPITYLAMWEIEYIFGALSNRWSWFCYMLMAI